MYAMICPACNYKSDADDRCPECGRYIYMSQMLVESRRKFVRVLLACHVLWFVIMVGLLIVLLTPGDGLARMFSGMYLTIGLVVFAVEAPLVYFFLYRPLDMPSVVRYLWCLIVGCSSVLLAWYFIWPSLLYKLFL